MSKNLLSFILLSVLFVCAPYTQSLAKKPSKQALHYAKTAVKHCPKHWDAPQCLKTISESAMVMTALYEEDLRKKGKPKGAEYLKKHCAAATAGTKDSSIPAYAFRSAFTDCANAISEINDQLKIGPDPSLYQLLVFSVLCLSEDKKLVCMAIEHQLVKNYK